MVDNRTDKTMDNMEGKRPKETKNFSSKIEKSALHLRGKVVSFRQRGRAAGDDMSGPIPNKKERGIHNDYSR